MTKFPTKGFVLAHGSEVLLTMPSWQGRHGCWLHGVRSQAAESRILVLGSLPPHLVQDPAQRNVLLIFRVSVPSSGNLEIPSQARPKLCFHNDPPIVYMKVYPS